MNPFSLDGARYYCAPPISGIAARPFNELQRNSLSKIRWIKEGETLFNEYRASALRDVERSVFLAASHYRRALDLMIPSSGHWAHVTLYYGAWYAARSLLGMFGCAVADRKVIDVDNSDPGTQRLKVQTIGRQQSSHKQFWDFFYQTVRHIAPFVSNPRDQAVLSPIYNNSSWMIEQRNKVNYDTDRSILANVNFAKKFSLDNFPASLPGELGTQYRVCERLLSVAYTFASQFDLETDTLDALTPHSTIDSKVADLVYRSTAPQWTATTHKQSIFTIS